MGKRNSNQFLELLNDFLNVYIVKTKGLSPNTQRSYKYAFKLLFDFCYEKGITSNKITFDTLSYELLDEFLNWLENNRNCSAVTRNQRLAAINSFSEYAAIRSIEATVTFRNAILKIPFKKSSAKTRTFFFKEELKILFNEPNKNTNIGKRDRTLLVFMYATGARAQEVCDLTIKNLSFEKDKTRITLQGKGNKVRVISIADNPSKILKEYYNEYLATKDINSHVFSSITHEKMTISCIEEIFKKYIKSARSKNTSLFTKNYSPHSMRHTTATHMFESGVPLLVIKNFLGHSSLETTQIYATVTQDKLDKTLVEWNEKWLIKSPTTKKSSNIPSFLK